MQLLMEYSNTILCNYCRQKLSVNPNETGFRCPGCKLHLPPQPIHNQSSGYEKNPRANSKLHPRPSLPIGLMKNARDQIPKQSLNIKPSPFMSSSSSRPKKRAVLCGVSYKRHKFRLKGTINDAKNMREMLMTSFGFPAEGILVFTEEEEPEHIPTRTNIQRALQWLVEGCRRGDSLVFYFSGHGLRQPDFKKDEIDGFDETICPVDFLKEGMILDNDINLAIVRPLKEGVKLHAIVDACHSGTILDLEYVYNRETRRWEDNRPPSGARKGTSGGLAICLSACGDSELASDTTAFTGKSMNGVMTYSMIEIVNKRSEVTYGELLDKIHDRIEEVRKAQCSSHCIRRIFGDSLSQKTQLSSSRVFDIDNTRFIL